MFVICNNKLTFKIMKKKQNDFVANPIHSNKGNFYSLRIVNKKIIFYSYIGIRMKLSINTLQNYLTLNILIRF